MLQPGGEGGRGEAFRHARRLAGVGQRHRAARCDRAGPRRRQVLGLDGEAVAELLERRGVRVFDYQNWSMLDTAEISRGKPKGKPREKFTRIDEMLAASTGRGNEAGRSFGSALEKTCRAMARS